MNTFGQRLKNFRKERKISQSDLAKSVGVGQTTIANYEKDLRFPNEVTLKALARELMISLDQLLDHKIKEKIILDEITIDALTDKFLNHIFNDEISQAKNLVLDIKESGVSTLEIFSKFFKSVQYKVGSLWEIGEISIGFEHHITSVIEELISVLGNEYNRVADDYKTAVFLTPSNEPHLLGLKIIKELFRSFGWKTYFLGSNIPWASIVEIVNKKAVQVIVVSVTLPENLNTTKAMIDYLRLNTKAKIMLGGQAFLSRDFVLEEIGPDYYTEEEEEVIELLEKL
jgi:methanogenic corrinoid protein MtbC1